MTPEEKQTYIEYRIERAHETLKETSMLLHEDHLHGAVNRTYYAMFYAVSALALQHDFSTSSHSQLRGFFNREFVKTGKFPVSMGRAFGFAYDNRTKGDYQDLVNFESLQVTELLREAERFIDYLYTLITTE